MFGIDGLNKEHFDKAADLLAKGQCVVAGLAFDMGQWPSCFYGSAYYLAFNQVATNGPSEENNDLERELRRLFTFAYLSDKYVALIYQRIVEYGELNLSKADLRWADLEGANLSKANLYEANLRWANLEGADLRWADLEGANLYEANLSKANLYEANLEGANLYEANLYEANLEGANLYEANLEGANLEGANLEGAKYNKWTVFPDGFDPESAGIIIVG